MSFDIVLHGTTRIRQFAHAVTCAAKMTDAVSFEVDPDSVSIRGVSPSKSSHVVIVIGSDSFEHFSVAPEPRTALEHSRALVHELRPAAVPPSEFPARFPFVVIPSKALFPSLLRASVSPSVTKIALSYDSAVAPGAAALHVWGSQGVARHFVLHLDNREYHRAETDDRDFAFDCSADGRDWLGLLSSFPPSAAQLHIVAMPSRLSLRLIDARIDAHAASGDASHTVLGTTVSVEPRRFASYRHPGAAAAPRPAAGAAALLPAASGLLNATSGIMSQAVPPMTFQAAAHQAHDGAASSPCGKTFECKPLRVFMLFAEAMHRGVRFRLGGPGTPVRADLCARVQPGIAQAFAVAQHRNYDSGVGQVAASADGPLNVRFSSLLIAAADDASVATTQAPRDSVGGRVTATAPGLAAEPPAPAGVAPSSAAAAAAAGTVSAPAGFLSQTRPSSSAVLRASALPVRAQPPSVTPPQSGRAPLQAPSAGCGNGGDDIERHRHSGARRELVPSSGGASDAPYRHSTGQPQHRHPQQDELGRASVASSYAIPQTAGGGASSAALGGGDSSFVEATRPSLLPSSSDQSVSSGGPMPHQNGSDGHPPPAPLAAAVPVDSAALRRGALALDLDWIVSNAGVSRSAARQSASVDRRVGGADAFDFTTLMLLANDDASGDIDEDDRSASREGSPWSDAGRSGH